MLVSQHNPIAHQAIQDQLPHIPWVVAVLQFNPKYEFHWHGHPVMSKYKIIDPDEVDEWCRQKRFTYVYLVSQTDKLLMRLIADAQFKHFDDPTDWFLIKLIRQKAAYARAR